ncbi:hypothetical protein E0H75_37640 [Kribbella capetownensis]|uniref:Phytase-like domain-containing protein n=1 Tax=Kribbella capetownensis TaxID=1572659 RepID=A0A4V2M6J9_9ACTN|nr:hypothetical protein E0H75_37640 [Kribbella capetownensis]
MLGLAACQGSRRCQPVFTCSDERRADVLVEASTYVSRVIGRLALVGTSVLVTAALLARLQRVVLRPSANILGTAWDSTTTTPSYEALADPAAAGVPVLSKKLFLDLNTVAGAPKKIEGVALLPQDTLVVINDNDFGMTDGPGAFDAHGNLVDSDIETTLVTIKLR